SSFHASYLSLCAPGAAPLPRLGLAGFCTGARAARASCGAGRVAVVRLGAGMVVAVAPPACAMALPAIELDQVSLGWRDRIAVRDVSGAFARGSLTAIVGPNGAGKSTLLKGITGQLSPLRGTIRIAGGPGAIACLPQSGELEHSFPV